MVHTWQGMFHGHSACPYNQTPVNHTCLTPLTGCYRLGVDVSGGAWCPMNRVGPESYEWIQIDLPGLHRVNAVATQGRYMNNSVSQHWTVSRTSIDMSFIWTIYNDHFKDIQYVLMYSTLCSRAMNGCPRTGYNTDAYTTQNGEHTEIGTKTRWHFELHYLYIWTT